jgi:hypothetical protein
MVSNQELKEILQEKRTGSNIKGYLVCDTCKGSYELQPGEKPGDYSSECECGGRLTYNRNISASNKDTKLKKIKILGSVFFVMFIILAIYEIPVLYMYMYGTQASINGNVASSADYNQLNNLTTNYEALEAQDASLGSKVQSSNNANLKNAYTNSQLQLRQSNTEIRNIGTVLSTRQSQNKIEKAITADQSQLAIAKESVNNVTSMM